MNEPENIHPPQWPLRLLRAFVKKEYLEEIEGDMEELFQDTLVQSSLPIARRAYTIEMLKLFRPVLLKNTQLFKYLGQPTMFKNYVKVSIRGLMKNPVNSFINVFGLSVAIGICIVAFVFIENDYSIDLFHKNKDKVYLATFFADRDGASGQYGLSPRPLGDLLRQDFAQIKKVCRIEDRSVVLKRADNVFYERVRFADPEFLDLFTFPLKWGVKSSLSDINSIILSEDMSIKYFGDENPIGQDLLMIFEDQSKKAFKVTGVAAAFPKAHDIEFNFLVNFENMLSSQPRYDKSDWGEFVTATFVQIDHPSSVRAIEQAMKKYTSLQNQAQPDWPISSFAFEPLTTLHEHSANIKNGITHGVNDVGRVGMPLIAIFMIVLACFNYINIAIVTAVKRLKEIGVRKAIGASRGKVIVQFLTENTVITFFSLAMGFFFGAAIFLPWFAQFSGYHLELNLVNGNFWLFLCGVVLFTGIVSGIYPAFYISRFDTVKIFKGSLQFGKNNPLTKLFLGIQLVLACITITIGIVFTQNNTYQKNLSWGYQQQGALYATVPDQAAFDKLNAAIASNRNVLSLSGSKDHLGKILPTAIVRLQPNRHYEADQLAVDAGYFETMGMQLKEGRLFLNHHESDKKAVVVNERFVRNTNMTNPVGQKVEMDSVLYDVIGVVRDFHNENFFHEIKPSVFKIADEKDYRYLSLRVRSGSEKETYQALQDQWIKLYPEIPFQGGFQNDVWSNYFHRVDQSGEFSNVVAVIAMLLASLGLYGLVSLNVSGRVKEFSIRKLLGASVSNLTSVITRPYLLLAAVTLFIGAPVSYVLTKAYLSMFFAYPMPMGYSVVILPVAILTIVLLAVVSTQIAKVVRTNPVDGLKVE